ncbi:uncharacterized protein Triagg1_7411 [Trichoderma aggressivum f. europaeum]|uniref:Protein-lysine N-methyltransferase EFM5 n=1 Tax=Trichoderma aggressivum f. europaeum TaxID=173218 RepID=A0AAE1IDV0_9HYPO|nr:hypothetical protein Triagg1_7411 [Trichoderma aggressivum f. europaeum]
MSDSDDEPITLSAHALAALKSFEAERDEHQAKFQRLKDEAESNSLLSIDTFQEDWNESQFWYSEETANILATELLRDATSDMTIGVVSAPSVFVALRNLLRDRSDDEKPKLVLLEHDNRFGVFPEFFFYDFQQPVKLPAALTVRWLLKPSSGGPSPNLIVCTGERMESLILKLYKALGVQTTAFEPKHTRGLSNEFYCYANFECPNWKWR